MDDNKNASIKEFGSSLESTETDNSEIVTEKDITTPEDKKSEPIIKNSFLRELMSWVIPIVISIATVVLIINFVARPVLVDGNSMYPTLHNQDRLITVTPYGKFQRGDIVAIRSTNGNLPLIKRVIGIAGDTIDIDYTTNRVILNGTPVEEDYTFESMREPSFQTLKFPLTVEEGKVFVLGDNRNNSDDSRDPRIGLIDEDDIFGKAKFRFWPFERFGGLK